MRHLNSCNLNQFIELVDDKKFDRIISANCKKEIKENDILYLQEIFLLSGFHNIKFLNLKFGNELIDDMLESLGCYCDVQFLNTSDDSELYGVLCGAYFNSNLEECLLNFNWPDILIIELSDIIVSKPWFGRFLFLINDFNFINSISVVLVS